MWAACVSRPLGCCYSRDEDLDSFLTRSPVSDPAATRQTLLARFPRSTSSLVPEPPQYVPGAVDAVGDEPDDPGHALEWRIVKSGIEPDEHAKLRDFAARVEGLDTHPACKTRPMGRQPQVLLRFLRGRDGNVDKAVKMFRDMLDWRHQFGIDEKVSKWRRELQEGKSRNALLVKRYGVEANICLDKYGIPVKLVRLSVADSAGCMREVGEEAILVDSLLRVEAAHAQIRLAMFRSKKLHRGQIQIIDVGDYAHHGVPNWSSRMWDAYTCGRGVYKVFDLNFPETVRKVFFVRTNFAIDNLWRMARRSGLVPVRTERKLRLFGQQASTWLGELREELSEREELPEFLECDTEEAFARAEPKGGIIPLHAGLPPASAPVPVRRSLSLPIAPRRPKERLHEVQSRAWPRLQMVVAVLVMAVTMLTADAATREWLFHTSSLEGVGVSPNGQS